MVSVFFPWNRRTPYAYSLTWAGSQAADLSGSPNTASRCQRDRSSSYSMSWIATPRTSIPKTGPDLHMHSGPLRSRTSRARSPEQSSTSAKASVNQPVLAIDRESHLLACRASEDHLDLWSIQWGAEPGLMYTLQLNEHAPLRLRFNPDSSLLAALMDYGSIAVWRLADKTVTSAMPPDSDTILDVAFTGPSAPSTRRACSPIGLSSQRRSPGQWANKTSCRQLPGPSVRPDTQCHDRG